MTTFVEKLQAKWRAGRRVCVGLDSDPRKLPAKYLHPTGYGMVDLFNLEIIEATYDLALCYKPNIAFYSGRYAPDSLRALSYTIGKIREFDPDMPVILDAKRGDIANTNVGYIEEAFESFGADAVTVSPYLGLEAMRPFLDQKDKGIIVLCKTSNTGSGEFQDLLVEYEGARRPLYQAVAHRVATAWNYNNNCALVVGATYPTQLRPVRELAPDVPILIPGIGAQGGDLEKSVKNGVDRRKGGIIINSSSGLIFSPDPRAAAQKLTDEIDAALAQLP